MGAVKQMLIEQMEREYKEAQSLAEDTEDYEHAYTAGEWRLFNARLQQLQDIFISYGLEKTDAMRVTLSALDAAFSKSEAYTFWRSYR